MRSDFLSLLVLLAFVFGFDQGAFAMDVRLDTASAKAVLVALDNGRLSLSEARVVAQLPGNQGLIRKGNSYHVPVTTEAFAEALVAAAHGESMDSLTARYLGFDQLKPNTDALATLIARIEAQPKAFEAWVVDRVGLFSPPDPAISIDGFLVVGGNSGGFAFDEPIFYLNLNYFNEFDPARLVLAHELYHAVQVVQSVENDDKWLKPERPTDRGRVRQQMCANLSKLFSNLYQEGSASYVGDPMLLTADMGALAQKTRQVFADGLDNLGAHITLLELSVVGLQAAKPVPYDDVYALGFYIPEPLYGVGYVMAKAIVADEGPQALAGLLKLPGYSFTQRYAALPRYGKDRDHPALGPNTLAAVQLLESGCAMD